MNPNGVRVTLSLWGSPDHRLPRHYILQKKVMVSRELLVDEATITINRAFNSDAVEIRNAIKEMDELIASHPSLNIEAE